MVEPRRPLVWRCRVQQGQVSDLEIQAAEIEQLHRLMEKVLADPPQQTLEQVSADVERDTIFTAQGAKEHGLIDHVVAPRSVPGAS
ncbi:ATP-dependent Clp protease proteolytic subunit [Streptomyces sp. NPDC018019]|uniref:ATP-dependent Clp protease proteolytic subunit n=1 Tax=Streptomyces sp. NPDC018019 TaxID=3365030 RepID=UPI0037A4F93A